MEDKVRDFLELCVKQEQKWMYHYPVGHFMFGVETDKYGWCTQVLKGNATVQELVAYFEKHYGKDEERFVGHIKELLGGN